MKNPSITNPVSRHLVVTDVQRCLAFYRDVLDFDIDAGENEAVYGPARIIFHTCPDAVDSTGPLRPPGAAMVFFQTNALDLLWDKLRNRGGNPGSREKVNWLKIRLFMVRDPDGHQLWFGQSYDEPFIPREISGGQLRSIMPHLPSANVAAAVVWYRDMLGFSVNYAQHDLGVMDRDRVTLLLVERAGGVLPGSVAGDAKPGDVAGGAQPGGACSLYVADVDALYEELISRGVVALGAPVSQPWGLRSFTIVDPEKNTITFSQTFE